MAKKEEAVIVIKKIDGGGAPFHGGSWKVALADFMTALMCFFLVMWLVSQSEETRKAVSDYFSTPSVIEYNFSTYGGELTLEKLFLDFINDPLAAVQQFVQSADKTPNVMSFNNDKIVSAYATEEIGDIAKNVTTLPGLIEFDIPDYQIFVPGTATPTAQFATVLDKIRRITTGLEESEIQIYSMLFYQSVADGTKETADKVSQNRLDLVSEKVKTSLEHDTVEVKTQSVTKSSTNAQDGRKPSGMIHIRIKKKEYAAATTGLQPKKIEDIRRKELSSDMSVYDEFVDKLSTTKK